MTEAAAEDTPRAIGRAGADTRALLMDAAELEFADRGFATTTTRDITRRANINQALIHYYFGSKAALFEAVVRRRASMIVEERQRLLSQAQVAALGGVPRLADIIYAFVAPPMRQAEESEGGRAFCRIIARLHHDPVSSARVVIDEIYTQSTRDFAKAIWAVVPELSEETVFWRLNFTIGAYHYTLADTGRLESISGGKCTTRDIERAIREMVAFLSGGFRSIAPSRLSNWE